jgi:rod shape-determining protein MreD
MVLEGIVIFIGILFSDFLNGSELFELGNSIKPDFILIITVFFALKRGPFAGIWVGFIGGILTDADLGIIMDSNVDPITMIGLHSFAYTLIGFLVGNYLRSVYRDSTLATGLLTFAACLVSRFIIYLFYYLFFGSIESYSFFSVSIYTAILAATVWFSLLAWLYKIEQKQDLI